MDVRRVEGSYGQAQWPRAWLKCLGVSWVYGGNMVGERRGARV